MSDKAKLYAKLARVMGKLGSISKEGHNASFGYDFIRDVDVNNALRPLLAEEGVAILVGMESVEQDTITSGSGNTGYHTVARMTVTFADGETGETHTIPWYGEANDYQDKSVNKCATAGLKYCLLKTFMVGSDDDPDAGSPARRSKHVQRDNGGDYSGIRAEKVGFGKYSEKTWGWVQDNEPGYLNWLAENSDYEDTLNKVDALLSGDKERSDLDPKLLDRWAVTAAEAESLGIDFDPLPDDATADTVLGRGKALRQLIDAKKRNGSWPADVMEKIVQNGLSENRYSVEATLKKSALKPSDSYQKVENWFAIYRGERTEDVEPDEAAATANTWLETNYG